eukprot:scaffold55127_cov29-Prasinocladus_malaysianus.AAC.1
MKPCTQIRVDQSAGKRAPAVGTAAAGRTSGSAALSKPSNLQLSGAWAFYESRHQADNETIRALERKVKELESKNDRLVNDLQQATAQLSAQQTQASISDNERRTLESRLKDLQVSHRTLQNTSSKDIERMSREVNMLRTQNEVLRAQTFQAQQESMDAQKALATTSEDLAQSQDLERQLVERLEAAEAEAAEATGRANALASDNKTLLRQRDHHISHAELLMKEKNRYFTMMQGLKRAGVACALAEDESQPNQSEQRQKSPAQGTLKQSPKLKSAASTKSRRAMKQRLLLLASHATDTRSAVNAVFCLVLHEGCVKAGSAAFSAKDAIREAQRMRARSASTTPVKVSDVKVGSEHPTY